MSFIFILIGLAIALTPARVLVKLDNRTGYWIYKKKLEYTRDEEAALRSAGIFYKIFGSIFSLLVYLYFSMRYRLCKYSIITNVLSGVNQAVKPN